MRALTWSTDGAGVPCIIPVYFPHGPQNHNFYGPVLIMSLSRVEKTVVAPPAPQESVYMSQHGIQGACRILSLMNLLASLESYQVSDSTL